MKRNILYLAGALISSAILMLSCSEDIPTYSELTVNKTDVFIQADGQNPNETVNITSGNGNYKLDIADDNIATAIIEGNSVIINGLHNGATTITITDWTKHSAVINVKVKEDFELKTDKEEITLFLNDEEKNTALINIASGNGGYKVESSNEQVAIAELNDNNQILITALSSDFCDVILTDADGNKVTIKVAVCKDYLVLEDMEGKACVVNKTLDINIISGNDEYSVVSENTEIATAEIVDGVIKVTGISKGEVNITVTDRMKLTATVKIPVTEDFIIETTHIPNLWIDETETQEITIVDGSGNYTITSSESISCVLSDDKNKLVVSGVKEKFALNQNIKITDNVFEKTIEITVSEVNYRFEEYGIARRYVQGKLAGIPYSYITTEGERVHIKIGEKPKTGNNALNGFHLSFNGGREEGLKTDPVIYTTKGAGFAGLGGGEDDKAFTITDLEIVKREYTKEADEAEGKGKFWIRFKEEGKEEYSYIITWF
ncbi:hypothetical protein [Bacteroides congonensis]|uniref:hypothetical protein n=1 Tax=Bacteroides congonensis TaxID=1871006 RepID=UPI002FD98DFC